MRNKEKVNKEMAGDHPCPVCRAPLQTLEVEEVHVEACVNHGFWFGRGDFDMIRRRAAHEVDGGAAVSRLEALLDATDCPFRKGVMLAETLQRVTLRDPDAPVESPLDKPCPVCGVLMRQGEWRDLGKQSRDVEVDLCEEHGLWLDPGEMEILLARARGSRRLLRRS